MAVHSAARRLMGLHRVLRTKAEVATLGFVMTFGAIRGLTYSIHMRIGPFHDVSAGGTHIHHMVWGIFLLLAVGYVRLLIDGSPSQPAPGLIRGLMAAAYGAGAALTLDEFALWLNMRDVYWQAQGWESVGAVSIFAGVLLAGIWGPRLLEAATRTSQTKAPSGVAQPTAWAGGE